MFKNYLTTTLRNLWKNKTYSFLNIFGLATGIACASLIFLWMEDELQFDAVYPRKDQLYWIKTYQTYEGKTRVFNSSPGPLAAAIVTEVPGIADACRVNQRTILFNAGEQSIFEKGCYADSTFFRLFDTQFVQGKAKDAFAQLYSVVISEKMAARFFGSAANAYGKVFKVDNDQSYVVSGVMKDLPENSTLQLDWIAPYAIYAKTRDFLTRWGAYATNTYVALTPNANVAAINKQLYYFIERKEAGAAARPFLFSMNDWHLRDNFEDGKQTGGRITYVRMFGYIAWIILLIACINFMNLATARSGKRAREIGVRKVMGAGKRMLTLQFIGEAVCMAVLAVVIAVAMVAMLLPLFNVLVEKQLTLGLNNPWHIPALLVIALICGLVAGSYPSLYMSSFHPVAVLKGLKQQAGSAPFIRKVLVVFQFAASIVLIISTIVIYQQIQHVKHRDLGYRKDNLVATALEGRLREDFTAIKQDLLNTGVVEHVAMTSDAMLYVGNNSSNYSWQGKDPQSDILISYRPVSPEFLDTWGMQLEEGRGFHTNIAADSANVLISASLARMMGKGSALGKTIQNGDRSLQVIGVVKDYVYGDMYRHGDPVIFFSDPMATDEMVIRLKAGIDREAAMKKITQVMKKDNPVYPFNYRFVDDQVNAFFKSEILIGKLSNVFAVLAVVISCLGLFGLAAYTAERRTKEIGIRKVLGASVSGITTLLSKDFMQLVLLAAVLAFPLAWWVMDRWLSNYAYRINISIWVFVAAMLIAAFIALVTISFQAVKAAMMDPVKSLRAE
jgi:predicted permease